jgi:hypothetical protein
MGGKRAMVLGVLLVSVFVTGCVDKTFFGFVTDSKTITAVTPEGVKEPGKPMVALSEDTSEVVDPATFERIFLSGNDGAVSNGGTPCTWKLGKPRRIREIWTYHWNDAKGSSGGGVITLKSAAGETIGSWKVTRTADGQGGVPKAYWIAEMNMDLPAGTYTIIDSDPGTWAQNAKTAGVGHTWVMAEPE